MKTATLASGVRINYPRMPQSDFTILEARLAPQMKKDMDATVLDAAFNGEPAKPYASGSLQNLCGDYTPGSQQESDNSFAPPSEYPPEQKVVAIHADYLTKLFEQPDYMIEQFQKRMLERYHTAEAAAIEVDTLVGRGISGALTAQLLARATNRAFCVVRKSGDGTHSLNNLEGKLGKRWLFVDDLVCSGATLSTTKAVVARVAKYKGWHTQFIGAYTYLGNFLNIKTAEVSDEQV